MGIWSQAKQMAAQTPAARNRYVDFLRAISILFVISGHWLIATAYYVDGELKVGDILSVQPWTQWLSWLFQVMPIFFMVGGFSNAVSLNSAEKRNRGYAEWLASRLTRLFSPLLFLLLGWALLAVVMRLFGLGGEKIQLVTRASLIPTWFLAIYMLVVVLAPLSYRAWRRWGYASFWAFATLAMVTDLAYFQAGLRWLGWSNYFWVWLAVHQLGYAWFDRRLGSPARLLAYAAAGLIVLTLLIFQGPYPLAMAGSPDEGLSNSLPPKISLIALGVLQFGLLLAIEQPMQKWLNNIKVWAATVLINSMIMTVYLWHLTIMVALVGLAYLAGGIGLGVEPGSSEWWQSRPLWLGALTLVLIPVALALSPLERLQLNTKDTVPSAARQVGGAILICIGVAVLASFGFGDQPWQSLDVLSLSTVLTGGIISGLLPMPGRRRRQTTNP